jgi:2-C-methyl-D-erythritol 4-phosphate cytidylyltransferase
MSLMAGGNDEAGGLPGPVGVALPAAGSGRRMGGARKPFLELAGVPILLRAIRPFLEHPRVAAVRVALPAADAADPPPWLLEEDPRIQVVPGGETRAASVLAALEALPAEVEVVLVHDGARPLVDRGVIDRCLAGITLDQGAVAALPVTDTLKEVSPARVVEGTPERRRFWAAQTPQGFPLSLLLDAYRRGTDGVTDDASAVEREGGRVVLTEGSPANLKVTLPGDLELAGFWLARTRTGLNGGDGA